MSTWTYVKLTSSTDNLGDNHYQVRELKTGFVVRHIDCGDYQVAVEIASRIDAHWNVDE